MNHPIDLIEEKYRSLVENNPDGICLIMSAEQVFGVLGLSSLDLSESDLATFSMFANIISVALENARLHQKVKNELRVRKNTQEVLRKTKRRYRALVENVSTIAYIDLADDKVKDTRINSQLNKITGYDPEAWISEKGFSMKIAEEALRTALVEKDVQLHEMHHRMKNNLQAILYLVEGRINQVTNQETIAFLRGMEKQARDMDLTFEQLCQLDNLAEVKMKRYLHTLAENFSEAFSSEREVEICIESEDITMDIATAMPCGLMLIELVTNSYKHAFPSNLENTPRVVIKLTATEDFYNLEVSDNGVGLPKDLNEQDIASKGLKLVKLCATRQLGGAFEIEEGEGAVIRITFPKKSG